MDAEESEEADEGDQEHSDEEVIELDEGNSVPDTKDSDVEMMSMEDKNFDDEDLKSLNEHLTAGGVAAGDKCLERIRKYKRSSEALVENNFKDLSKSAKDDLETSLIPSDFGLETPVAIKTLGNGNCLFHVASMFLRGDEDAHGLLRLLTAVELHRNARIYAYHPAKLDAANSLRRQEESLIPDMLTSDNGWSQWYRSKDRLKAVKAEAISVSVDKECSSLLVMMALSTVMRRPIFSLYPEIPFDVRKLFHRCLDHKN